MDDATADIDETLELFERYMAEGIIPTIKIQSGVASITDFWEVSSVAWMCSYMSDDENIYGLSSDETVVDTHLTTNIEWGAFAYLAHSSYGRNGNILSSSVRIESGEEWVNETSPYDADLQSLYSGVGTIMSISKYGEVEVLEYLEYTDILDSGTTNNITGIFDIKLLGTLDYHWIAGTDCYSESDSTVEQSYGDAMYEVSGTGTDDNGEEIAMSWDYVYLPSSYSYTETFHRQGEFSTIILDEVYAYYARFRPVIVVY